MSRILKEWKSYAEAYVRDFFLVDIRDSEFASFTFEYMWKLIKP